MSVMRPGSAESEARQNSIAGMMLQKKMVPGRVPQAGDRQISAKFLQGLNEGITRLQAGIPGSGAKPSIAYGRLDDNCFFDGAVHQSAAMSVYYYEGNDWLDTSDAITLECKVDLNTGQDPGFGFLHFGSWQRAVMVGDKWYPTYPNYYVVGYYSDTSVTVGSTGTFHVGYGWLSGDLRDSTDDLTLVRNIGCDTITGNSTFGGGSAQRCAAQWDNRADRWYAAPIEA